MPTWVSPAQGCPGITHLLPTHPGPKQTALSSHHPPLGTPLGKYRAFGRKGANGQEVASPGHPVGPSLSPRMGYTATPLLAASVIVGFPPQSGTQSPKWGHKIRVRSSSGCLPWRNGGPDLYRFPWNLSL